MGKLVMRRRITPDTIDALGETLAKLVFGRPKELDAPPSDDSLWMLAPKATYPVSSADPDRGIIALHDGSAAKPVRELTAFDLETQFHPYSLRYLDDAR